jgi:hypothetical protein
LPGNRAVPEIEGKDKPNGDKAARDKARDSMNAKEKKRSMP